MNISERYQLILDSLQRGHRYLEPLEMEERTFLQNELLSRPPEERLEQLLCIIDNTRDHCEEFEEPLIQLLQEYQDPRILIYLLNASRRHIIARNQKRGKRLSAAYLETLATLLKHSEAEVVEWTLRTIDECGAQAIFFRNQLQKIKPSVFSLFFNRHKKSIHEIIDMLERRWSSHL